MIIGAITLTGLGLKLGNGLVELPAATSC